MTVGIACPICRYLIGVADSNITIERPVSDVAGAGILGATASCSECKSVIFIGAHVDVILSELVDGAKRRVSAK